MATHEALQALRDENPQSFTNITWPRLPACEHGTGTGSPPCCSSGNGTPQCLTQAPRSFVTHEISAETDTVKVSAPGPGQSWDPHVPLRPPWTQGCPSRRSQLPTQPGSALTARSDPRLVSDSHSSSCASGCLCCLLRGAATRSRGPRDALCLSFPGARAGTGEHRVS